MKTLTCIFHSLHLRFQLDLHEKSRLKTIFSLNATVVASQTTISGITPHSGQVLPFSKFTSSKSKSEYYPYRSWLYEGLWSILADLHLTSVETKSGDISASYIYTTKKMIGRLWSSNPKENMFGLRIKPVTVLLPDIKHFTI